MSCCNCSVAAKGKAIPAVRSFAKRSAATQPDTGNMSSGGSSSHRSDSAGRTVTRFVVCEDASAAAAKQQNFWWSDQPPAYVMGIDCSVRSTGYCVLRTDPLFNLPQAVPPPCPPPLARVAACGSISTGVGAVSSIDPARFLTDIRSCISQVKRGVEEACGAGTWLVVVEECLMQYQGRRSSADTIVNLARFNALVSGARPRSRSPLPGPRPPPPPPIPCLLSYSHVSAWQPPPRSSSAVPLSKSTPASPKPRLGYL
jgi:hypothetical protein